LLLIVTELQIAVAASMSKWSLLNLYRFLWLNIEWH